MRRNHRGGVRMTNERVYGADKVRLYPNVTMQQFLMACCHAYRYFHNEALALNNQLFKRFHETNDVTYYPSRYTLSKELTKRRHELFWCGQVPAKLIQCACFDVVRAWERHMRHPDIAGRPTFTSRKHAELRFTVEGFRIVNGKLYLSKPLGYAKKLYGIKIRGLRDLTPRERRQHQKITIRYRNGKWFASIPWTKGYRPTVRQKDRRPINAVDLNVGHYTDITGNYDIEPQNLKNLRSKIRACDRIVSKKRVRNTCWMTSKRYAKAKAKRAVLYAKSANVQHDLIDKYVNWLVTNYDCVVIEDLDVRAMLHGIASRGVSRSGFGYFRVRLERSAILHDTEIIVADRLYPSTQRCSSCGHVKTGNDRITLRGNAKHHTSHDEYVCYEYGFTCDRDVNAVLNLLQYPNLTTIG